MSTITRSLLAFASIAAGMIHVAMITGAPPLVALVLAPLGLAEVVWGVLALARDTVVLPRVAIAGAIAPLVLWSLLVATAVVAKQPELAASVDLLPLGIATLFDLAIATVLIVRLRTAELQDARADRSAPPAWRTLASLMLGAVVVGSLTTPALAATEAGAYAQPHGGHTAVEPAEPAFVDPHGTHGDH